MSTRKQKAAARRNIKKAQKARWGCKPHKSHKRGGVRAPMSRVKTPLNRIRTLI